jgi:hypothetical protein
MRKSQVSSFVRRTGAEIFRRQADTTYDDGDEDALIDTAKLIDDAKVDKKMILNRYKKYWSVQLDKCVKTRKEELTQYKRRAKQHKWETEELSYTRDYVVPKEQLLREAEDDVAMMAALVNFLETN